MITPNNCEGTNCVCPKCGANFTCLATSSSPCDCSKIQLTPEQIGALSDRWTGCLCMRCLQQIVKNNGQINRLLLLTIKYFLQNCLNRVRLLPRSPVDLLRPHPWKPARATQRSFAMSQIVMLSLDEKTLLSELDRAGYKKMGVLVRTATNFEDLVRFSK